MSSGTIAWLKMNSDPLILRMLKIVSSTFQDVDFDGS